MKINVILLSVTLMMWLLPMNALAHTRYEVDEYAIIVGWATEPPIVDSKNAIYVEILRNDAPFEGADQTVDAQLQYAGQKYTTNLITTDKPGVYHSDTFIPTVRGSLDVLLMGDLDGTSIQLQTKPEEIVSAGQMQFPERIPSEFDQAKQAETVAQEAASARRWGISGTVLGVAGTILGVVGTLNRRKDNRGK